MKKSLVALAALAVAGVASAQSSVTLFGLVDLSVSGTTTKFENGQSASTTRLDSNGYQSNRIGFRGTEDLGGGLAASFWLEAGMNNDTGVVGSTSGPSNGSFFNRRSTVSLSGGFGELRLGRDYKPTFWNLTNFDPFGTNGQGTFVLQNLAGAATGAGALAFDSDNVRQSNTVGYFLPANLGGFYGQVMYGFDEKVKGADGYNPGLNADTRSGEYVGGRIGYANGPFDVAFAAGQQTTASNYTLGTDNTLTTYNIGASWDFGFMKLFGQYGLYDLDMEFVSATPAPTNLVPVPATTYSRVNANPQAWGGLLGVTVPVGPGLIRASYSYARVEDIPGANTNPSGSKFALGYIHNLSKRTALYATVAYLDNKNGLPLAVGGPTIAGTPDQSYGYDFGIRHSF